MRFFSSLNTYYRLLMLIISTTALFFLLFIFLYSYTKKQEKEVYKSAYKEYQNEANSIFELNSKTHIAAIIDVTFWDELVDFTKTKNEKWYKDYIEKEFPTYEVDYIGIFGLNQELLNKTTSSKLKTIDFIPKQIMPTLYKSKLVRFYMKVPEGVVEIFGATIHPSNDPKKNKSKPSGYFFMARLLNQKFVQNLGKISSSTIKITDTNYHVPTDENSIEVSLNLNDWKNDTIANVNFERPFNLNFYNTKKILFIIIIATILNFLIYFYYYRRWIYKPLKLITNTLEKENENSITGLKNAHGEFKHIGNLFEENNKQRKQLEIAKEKAEESDMLKSSFLANLSHEIRTPMNAIMGFSDLLHDTNLSEKDKTDYLKIIRNNGKNLISIIEDLIEMSKIDSKQIAPNYQSLDLDKCISELHRAIKITIPEEKRIEFLIHQSTSPLKQKILTDEIKLTQILTNLITNAIKFTKKGYVSIGYKVNEDDKILEIWVEDSGLGIDEKNVKIIFDRFRRVEDEFSIEISGLGLGLSITKAYVELLGGSINVKSTPGIGSTFSISIPLIYEETLIDVDFVQDTYKLSKAENETILIAEDDDINFLLIQKILQSKNYKILRAVNGKEAVEICKNNTNINLIFMDIKMPIMNGFEALELIRQFNKNLPIIANTAYSSFEDKEKIINAGFTNYISKPLNKNEIFYLLNSIFS
ncbi:response regulator [Pedobacter sp. UC225_61]|uniref:response regulator n=1 Tax=Pedobacter sp. UC225_61 TaxID=3374623 RepID=UPI0037B54EF7